MKKIASFPKRPVVLSALLSLLMGGILSLSQDELPASKLLPQGADACRYLVQPGDTLSKIASRFTGKGEYYKEIMQFNQLKSEQIRPGEQLNLPKELLLKAYQCSLTPTVASLPAPLPTPTLILTPTLTPTPTPTPKSTLTPPPRKSNTILAEIHGVVFEDRNGNGACEPDEPGLPGIKVVLLRDLVIRATDPAGRFRFENLQPGPQVVRLEEASLAQGFHLTTAAMVMLSLTEGDLEYIKFGVQKNTFNH